MVLAGSFRSDGAAHTVPAGYLGSDGGALTLNRLQRLRIQLCQLSCPRSVENDGYVVLREGTNDALDGSKRRCSDDLRVQPRPTQVGHQVGRCWLGAIKRDEHGFLSF